MSFGRGLIGGRGILIQQIMEATEKSETASCKDTTKSSADESLNIFGITDSGVGSLSRSAGRGQIFLDKFLDDQTDKASLKSESDDSSQCLPSSDGLSGIQSSTQFKISFGRGKVLQNIPKSTIPSIDASRNKPQLKVEELSKQLEVVKIENEVDPVIHRGMKGTPMNVIANYIRLKTDPNKGVFEYEVRFSPDIHSIQLRYKLLNQHREITGSTKTFDGVVLFLPFQLPENRTELTSKNENDNTSVQLTILYKRKKLMKECVQLYNILFDRIMRILKFVRFGRKNFDPSAPKLIPQHKLEIWPGYVTAVDEYEGGVMLCLDVSHRLLCTETVLDILTHAYLSDKNNFQQNALQSLLGAVVLTRYNNKTYRIDDILFDESPSSTFKMIDRDVSYVEYYKSHYNIDLCDKEQPLLISREDKRISGKVEKQTFTFCLIPELCYLTGITDTIRNDLKVMRDIATITRVTPNQRVDSMKTFCKNLTNCNEAKEVLINWGLELETKPLGLLARQLEDEEIIFGRGKIIKAEKGDFNKYSCNNQLYKVIDLTNWLVIHTKRDAKFATNFIDIMQRNCTPMGLKISPPKVECLTEDKNELYVQLLRKVINSSLQIIVIICPSSRDDRYAAIKKVCCGELPIPTQVINSRTLANEAKCRPIIAKIALQMNCKIGGSLWSIKIPFKNVMICGIDTYHDTKKKDNSVGAFVSSLNSSYTEWYSRAIFQSQKEELINGLSQSLINALAVYKQRNGELPAKIIIFRDGVGDGQLHMVKEYEIAQLLQACSLNNVNYKPLLTFIIVQKRINTRLFAVRNNGLENPSPGCVLDHTITRRYMYDYFLVPQNVRQGTVSPTHYIVLYDSNNFQPDVLQRLSYKMCFLYYNWPGTVRVPACCQYAHKLAFLVGQSVKKQPADILADKLYYL